MRRIVKAAMLLTSAATLACALVTPASADPTTVTHDDITILAPEPFRYLCPGLATAYNNQIPPRPAACWDDTGPSPITVKPNPPDNCTITRPNGSSAGINALDSDPQAATWPCVDVALSSRRRDNVKFPGDATKLFIPFADDELRYALSTPPVGVVSNGVDGLTNANLTSIYNCSVTDWHTFNPNVPVGTTIHALIPQSGSGTRSWFLSAIGMTDAQLGPCTMAVPENDPTPIANDANAIAPFSKPRSLYPVNYTDRIKLNTTGFVAYRTLYAVVRDAGGGTVPAYLQPFVGDGTQFNTAFICSAPALSIVTQQGFGTLPGHTMSSCGVAE